MVASRKKRLGQSKICKRSHEQQNPNAPFSSQLVSADERPPKRRVEDARMLLRALPQAPTEDDTQLHVVRNWVVDDKRVVVSFRCGAMRKTLQQYPDDVACISVDRKEKCLQNGWGIAAASIMCRNAAPVARVVGAAAVWTRSSTSLQAEPILQAAGSSFFQLSGYV